jgi:iron complex outermembrane recepter protein
MQVQRGLGASRLAVPSVGGSINILTKGIDAKAATNLTTELGSGDYLRTTVSTNTGRLKGGWGVSAAASYQNQKGIIDATNSNGFFYYLRVDKQLGKHMLSLSGFGAPQSHGQNTTRMGIGAVDTAYANSLSTVGVGQGADKRYALANYGRTYSSGWGYRKDGTPFSTRVNYYHKPQFTLRHTWQINEKLFLSNVAYVSIGTGGLLTTNGNFSRDPKTGLLDIAGAENVNIINAGNNNSAGAWQYSNHNDHRWFGLISNLDYAINKQFTFSGGIDARDYQGLHYREVTDMLSGSKVTAPFIPAISKNVVIHVGDRYQYDNTGYIRWGGAFGMLEYKNKKWSAFFNASGAMTGYKMVDHFKPKVVALSDTTFYLGGYKQTTSKVNAANGIIGFAPSVTYKGKTYTMASPEAKEQMIDWIYQPSYTFKIGAAYNLDKHHNVFFNAGWLSRAMRFNNVLRQNTGNVQQIIGIATDYKNEEVRAVEVGYGYRGKVFSANINAYYTKWDNKPLESLIPVTNLEGTTDYINVSGIGALHKGIEFDGAVSIFKNLSLDALASVGDWRWTTGGQYDGYDTGGRFTTFKFDPTGTHVGDAAQTQYGAGIRWEPAKGFYLKVRGTFFGDNYANFNPESLKDANVRRESWKMPDYWLLDANVGYSFNIDKKRRASVRLNVLNVLDALYISDALNNDTSTFTIGGNNSTNFDSRSAGVNFGLPRRFNASFMLEF